MDISQKPIVRRLILEQLAAVYPCGIPQNRISLGLQVGGVRISETELSGELAYLSGKDYVSTKKDTLSAANVFYFITAAGLDVIDR